jgi:hypothetical protein
MRPLPLERNDKCAVACQLEKELTDTKQQYVEKRNTLGERCTQFNSELDEWMKLSRELIVEGKRVTSVYKHDDSSSEVCCSLSIHAVLICATSSITRFHPQSLTGIE